MEKDGKEREISLEWRSIEVTCVNYVLLVTGGKVEEGTEVGRQIILFTTQPFPISNA